MIYVYFIGGPWDLTKRAFADNGLKDKRIVVGTAPVMPRGWYSEKEVKSGTEIVMIQHVYRIVGKVAQQGQDDMVVAVHEDMRP